MFCELCKGILILFCILIWISTAIWLSCTCCEGYQYFGMLECSSQNRLSFCDGNTCRLQGWICMSLLRNGIHLMCHIVHDKASCPAVCIMCFHLKRIGGFDLVTDFTMVTNTNNMNILYSVSSVLLILEIVNEKVWIFFTDGVSFSSLVIFHRSSASFFRLTTSITAHYHCFVDPFECKDTVLT